jgi:hypothetical protein
MSGMHTAYLQADWSCSAVLVACPFTICVMPAAGSAYWWPAHSSMAGATRWRRRRSWRRWQPRARLQVPAARWCPEAPQHLSFSVCVKKATEGVSGMCHLVDKGQMAVAHMSAHTSVCGASCSCCRCASFCCQSHICHGCCQFRTIQGQCVRAACSWDAAP